MKRILAIFSVVCCTILFACVPQASAGELDVLLEKLVDKGVLTPIEATIIKDETKQAVTEEVSQGKSYAVPSWTQKLKIKQDLRLRYQTEVRDSDVKHRHRARVRYRLGVISNPFKDVEIGFGLATGSSDPRSTNQTLGDNFSSKGINVDYAYAQWKVTGDIKAVAGKFKRKPYLWEPTDLLWDGDINPEGFSMNLQKEFFANSKSYLNVGLWNIDERDQNQGDLGNAYMYYAQLGNKWSDNGLDAQVAATVYKFSNVKGNELGDNKVVGDNGGSDTNTEINNLLAFDYDSSVISGEFGVKNPFGFENIQRFAVFGQFVRNFSISKDHKGWSSGFKFGHKKVKKPGNWQFKYIYAELQRDAWLDIFPDSDRYGGKTDIKAHEVVFQYALRKNLILGLDLYKSQRLDQGKNKEVLGQFDMIFKF